MINIFYTLPQLESKHLTDLKYRNLKYRFNKLLHNNKIEIGEYVYKSSNKWYIHYSLVDLFQPIRKHSTHTKINYVCEVSINLSDRYDIEGYKYLGDSVVKELHPFITKYCIEQGVWHKNNFHIHFETTAQIQYIRWALFDIGKRLEIDILGNPNTHISNIQNKTLYSNYIRKAIRASGGSIDHGFSGIDSFDDGRHRVG